MDEQRDRSLGLDSDDIDRIYRNNNDNGNSRARTVISRNQ